MSDPDPPATERATPAIEPAAASDPATELRGEPERPDVKAGSSGAPDARPRPFIERLGLALIALVMAALFAVVALSAFAGGEPFLGVMAAIGCLMIVWVGGLTLLRG